MAQPRSNYANRASHVPPARLIALLTAALVTLTPATAQTVPPAPTTYQRAIAAGYKAAMYCSGIFTAGRTPAQIDADELTGIYPEYNAIVPTLTAQVDAAAHMVSVAYVATMPPRLSVWRAGLGCTSLPIGTTAAAASTRFAADRFAPNPRGTLGSAQSDPSPWPMGDGEIAPRPAPALSAVITAAFDGSHGAGSKTTGVVVLHDGRIIAERYRDGWGALVPNRTWSAAKSLAGTLIGLATTFQIPLGAHASMPVTLGPGLSAGWDDDFDPRHAITLDGLLRMASGLRSDTAGNRTDAIYFGGTTVDEQAPGWSLEVPPGTRFRYANNDILLAMLFVRHQIGGQAYDDLPAGLLLRLGMRHTVAEQDWHGNYILSSQVWSTARDLARLGQFWLQDGVWQGQRLLPEGWMRYMTTPSGPQPADGPGYGATMWLFGPKQGLPAGSYAAQGNRGQYVMVIPSAKLVIVRRGEDPGAARFDIAKFTADVLTALQ